MGPLDGPLRHLDGHLGPLNGFMGHLDGYLKPLKVYLCLADYLGQLDGYLGHWDDYFGPLNGHMEPLDGPLGLLDGHLRPLDGHFGCLDSYLNFFPNNFLFFYINEYRKGYSLPLYGSQFKDFFFLRSTPPVASLKSSRKAKDWVFYHFKDFFVVFWGFFQSFFSIAPQLVDNVITERNHEQQGSTS